LFNDLGKSGSGKGWGIRRGVFDREIGDMEEQLKFDVTNGLIRSSGSIWVR
jgi:hypothetical protein